MQRGIPLSCNEIPAGTGLVQTVECKGIAERVEVREGERGFLGRRGRPKQTHQIVEPLEDPVVAEISTFSSGIRRVCCLYAQESFLRNDDI